MKKSIILTLLYFLMAQPIIAQQSDTLIDTLNFILFEDIPQEKLIYKFYCHFEDKDYSRAVRYNDLREKKVRSVCKAIRDSKDETLIPMLVEILKKQEKYFLEEWEVAWKDGAGPYGIYYDQYHILIDIDITIGYLIMEKEQWDTAQKYAYLKNLYMLIQGDYDSIRIENTLFISDYIRNVKNGYSNSSLFLPSASTHTLIDQMSDELLENILLDISSADVSEMNDGEKKYYLIGLRKTLVMNPDARIDTILIDKGEFYDALDFLKIEQNEPLLTLKYYHLLLDRYLLNNQNTDLLIPLANDIFNESNAIRANIAFVGLFLGKSGSKGKEIFIKRLTRRIIESEDKQALEYMELSVSLLNKADAILVKKKIEGSTSELRVSQYDKLIKEKYEVE